MVELSVQPCGPDDDVAVAAYVAISQAARAADSPWEPSPTERQLAGALRHGWDGEPDRAVLGLVDGRPVATGGVNMSERDNLHSAWLHLAVHPQRRRQGLGTAMLDHLVGVARDHGRTTLGCHAWDGTPGAGFAVRHGFEQRSVAVNRRQVLADVDWSVLEQLHAEATAVASAYEVLHRTGASPEEELEAVAAMTAAINDAPLDDLDLEDEVYDAERTRAYETAQEAQGRRLRRVLVRHRETGELAGHTVVAVDEERPEQADQHDTSVVAAHRGHRLGLLLKTEMNLWLRDVEPQLDWVDTWNAESNHHMIGVNEQLGYRVLGRELQFQRALG